MNFPGNTFLYRVFQSDKKLFVVFTVYVLGVLYFALRQREEFPFLLYGMYSLKEESKPLYITYQIAIDGKILETTKLKDAKSELITSSLVHIAASIKTGEANNSDLAEYAKWLLKYVGEGNFLGIYELTCRYNNNGEPLVVKRELIYANH